MVFKSIVLCYTDLGDDSGLRLMIDSKLRPNDAGILQLGLGIGPDFQVVPPRQEKFTATGHCSDTCLNQVCFVINTLCYYCRTKSLLPCSNELPSSKRILGRLENGFVSQLVVNS